jgi:hypothetical protein
MLLPNEAVAFEQSVTLTALPPNWQSYGWFEMYQKCTFRPDAVLPALHQFREALLAARALLAERAHIMIEANAQLQLGVDAQASISQHTCVPNHNAAPPLMPSIAPMLDKKAWSAVLARGTWFYRSFGAPVIRA